MAKCALCGAKKGKRFCHLKQGDVCSECCGQTQGKGFEPCAPCEHLRGPSSRDYRDAPAYSLRFMEESDAAREVGLLIEGTVVGLYRHEWPELTDAHAIAAYERLLDLYHYGDKLDVTEPLVAAAVEAVIKRLPAEAMPLVPGVLGVLRRSARGRTLGGTEYLRVMCRYIPDGVV